MSKSLPFKPNLEHLKGQAKRLKKILSKTNSSVKLQFAQNHLAREYGFIDWSQLTKHLEKLSQAEELVHRFGSTHGRAFPALRRSGKVDAVILQAGTHSPNPNVRFGCLQLLDHLGSKDCLETLIKATFDPVPRVRMIAVHALGCQQCKEKPFQTEVLPHLLRCALEDPNEKVRYQAIHGLGRFRDHPAVVETLERIVQQALSSRLRRAVQSALGVRQK